MNGLLLVLIIALVVSAAAAYWLVARRKAPRSTAPPPSLAMKAGGRFGAVQIRPRMDACRAAQLLQGHPFLAKNAPALPLRECNAPRCSCTFSKLPDRRSDGRRLEHGGLHTTLFIAANRRTKRDRRRAAQPARQH
jgi:hypothetical protein